jgi:hypothetical protein
MRIAYVITRADAVDATIHVRDIAGAMRDRGHEVLVLVGGEGPVTSYRLLDRSRRAWIVSAIFRKPAFCLILTRKAAS